MIGQSIAHYRITAKLGEGGMGEVWRATDTKLNREVALKVLPESFAQDPDRMARFQREAHVLAALNHPNIAAIYGLEDRALVMELVEGKPLTGPLPVDTALHYARQIVEALDAAHEKGITHRDLKPANILVTAEGHVKVLDFGLAKAAEVTAAPGENSPTLTLAATRLGVIMGTAGYMAPEQARGQQVDTRADIWAFGVVLFEMLTGKRLFAGETISDTLASVLTREVDFAALPAETPALLKRLLRRCLERDRKKRLRDIADARLDLDETVSAPDSVAQAPPPSKRSRLPWALASVAVLAACALGFALWRSRQPVAKPLLHLSVDLGADTRLYPFGPNLAFSPDGTRLAYSSTAADGTWRIYLRRLDQPEATALASTESGGHPFFSPDGQWVAFFANRKLQKVSINGGAAITVSDSAADRGGSWGEDGQIVAALGMQSGLSRIPSAGGQPVALTEVDRKKKEDSHRWPQVLPGAKTVLFTAGQNGNFDEANIDVVSLASGQRKTVFRGGYFARYLSGYLVYVNRNTLFAAPFDLDRLETTAQPVPVLEGLYANLVQGSAYYAFSRAGNFVYHQGKAGGHNATIQWLSRDGVAEPLLAKPGMYYHPRLSPDGKHLALIVNDGYSDEIWVYNLARDAMTRLTFNAGTKSSPVWSPNGKFIFFGNQDGLWCAPADGSSREQRLLQTAGGTFPNSFSPEGNWLTYFQLDTKSNWDIQFVPIEWQPQQPPRAGKPKPFQDTPAVEVFPNVSPDGRWLAYMSTESGVAEIYVRPVPWAGSVAGGKWQISNDRGDLPFWAPGGNVLYYRRDDRIMAVSYSVNGSTFSAGKPQLWSEKSLVPTGRDANFDLAPDGKRFVVVRTVGDQGELKPINHLTLLLNFSDEIKRRISSAAAGQ